METFVWDSHFDTGLGMVDEQHHRLVDLINQLGDTLASGQSGSRDALQSVYDALAAYARYHFAEEERLMEQAPLDARHIAAHRESHRRFIEQTASMWAARNATTAPVTVLHEFLAAWLSFHILGEDHTMARQIERVAAGVSPVVAYEGDDTPKDTATHALLRAVGNLYQVLSQQNRDLARANQILELRVAERTDELVRANLELENASRTDGLLGIANRRWLDASLAREWGRAVRERTTLALCMLDVDWFKLYNDRYGHQAGDECLRAIARACAAALRRPADLLARYGGEELVAMLPNTNLEGARVVARNIQEAVARLRLPHAASPFVDRVTVSIGVAAATPERGSDRAALLAAADRALYAAKEAGRDRIAG